MIEHLTCSQCGGNEFYVMVSERHGDLAEITCTNCEHVEMQ